MPSSTLKLEGPEQVAYRRWGPQGPLTGASTVLALHGIESHSGWFEALGEALAPHGVSLIAYDRKGWGESAGARGRLESPRRALAELWGVMDALNLARVHLLGLSFGGLLALYASMKARPRFRSVALVSPGLFPRRMPGPGQSLALAAAFILRLPRTHALPYLAEDFVRDPELVRRVAGDPLRVTTIGADTAGSLYLMRRFVARELERSAPQTLTTWLTDEDPIIDSRATAEALARAGSRVKTFEKAGHSLVLERPAELASELICHLS